ncbi:MAG: hypothetical protein H6551_11845 [Chitinophagales bacterium]|nr:hypothetical protein [Chitinophagaceae bacterium]MCB9065821.1 hypothetical protein [Chitinophagales bacterium]
MSYITSSFVHAEPLAQPKVSATKKQTVKADTQAQVNNTKDITVKILLFSAIVACVTLAVWI